MAADSGGTNGTDRTERYFAKPLPQDDDVEFSHRSYLSSRIGAAILACGASPEAAVGIEVTILVDLINKLSTVDEQPPFGVRKGVTLAKARIKSLGGRNAMVNAPSIKALRSQLHRKEHPVYLVGLIVRAVLMLRMFGAPTWALETARALIEQTYQPVIISRADHLGGDFVLAIREDETLRGIWTKYRKMASYCFVAFNHQVSLQPLIQDGGYESAVAFAHQAKRVQLQLRRALTAHAPGQTKSADPAAPKPRHYAMNQLLSLKSSALGSDEGRQLRGTIRAVLFPTTAEAAFIESLKRDVRRA